MDVPRGFCLDSRLFEGVMCIKVFPQEKYVFCIYMLNASDDSGSMSYERSRTFTSILRKVLQKSPGKKSSLNIIIIYIISGID